jgi:hypothetical protein
MWEELSLHCFISTHLSHQPLHPPPTHTSNASLPLSPTTLQQKAPQEKAAQSSKQSIDQASQKAIVPYVCVH